MADLLRGNLIPQSYMPSQEIVALRDLVRHRVRLGRLAAQLKNVVHSVLARQGKKCEWSDPTGIKAQLWLNNLELYPQNREELDDSLSLFDSANQKIKLLNKRVHEEAVKRPDIQLISSIPGFAEYSALLILAEIGDIQRFSTPEKLACFAGLNSSVYQSSSTLRQGGITKQGSQMVALDTG